LASWHGLIQRINSRNGAPWQTIFIIGLQLVKALCVYIIWILNLPLTKKLKGKQPITNILTIRTIHNHGNQSSKINKHGSQINALVNHCIWKIWKNNMSIPTIKIATINSAFLRPQSQESIKGNLNKHWSQILQVINQYIKGNQSALILVNQYIQK
jgi:hypothetical protein